MYKIKYAILRQPLILVLIAIIIGISIGEFSNVHSIRKNADTNYAMVIESVARLENISEKKDALEIKDYDILCAGEKLELSPESQMIISSFVNHHSKTAAEKTTTLTIGFDVIAFLFFIVFCDWIYQEDLIAKQNLKIARMTAENVGMAALMDAMMDAIESILDSESESDSDPDSNSGSESSSDSESETNSDSATGE